jgi:hypothetical protein
MPLETLSPALRRHRRRLAVSAVRLLDVILEVVAAGTFPPAAWRQERLHSAAELVAEVLAGPLAGCPKKPIPAFQTRPAENCPKIWPIREPQPHPTES